MKHTGLGCSIGFDPIQKNESINVQTTNFNITNGFMNTKMEDNLEKFKIRYNGQLSLCYY